MDEKVSKPLGKYSASPMQEVRLIKEWIRKQPHLPQQHEDIWLENFLKGCKFSVERFKEVFNKFYTVRSRLPQYFLSGDPTADAIRQISQVCYHTLLSDTPEGYTVLSRGLLDTDESKFDCEAYIQRELLIWNWILKTKVNITFILIFDMRGSSMMHITKILPHMKNFVLLLQDAMPFRLKQFHFIYANAGLKTLLSVTKPLLKEKLRNRIFVHTDDLSTLYDFIPQELLPNEYGGKAGSIQQLNDECQKKLEDVKDILIEEYKKKTDESKRIRDDTQNELFGIDGSFKSLNVD